MGEKTIEELAKLRLDSEHLIPVKPLTNTDQYAFDIKRKDLPTPTDVEDPGLLTGFDTSDTPLNIFQHPDKRAEEEGLFFGTQADQITPDQIENLKAENQSVAGNLFYRGPIRTILKVPREILKTVGFAVGGLAYGVESIFGDGDESLVFDNQFNKGVDGFFDMLNSGEGVGGLKVHTPTKVKEGDFWDNIGSSAFWANEGADAVGFMVSMFAPGMLISKLGMGAGIVKGLANTKLLKQMGKLGTFASDAAKLNKKGIDLTKLGSQIDNVAAAGFNTAAESIMEGSGVYVDVKQQALDKGYSPELANEIASKAATGTTLANLAILMGPNLILQNKWAKTFKPQKNLISDILNPNINKTLLKTKTIGKNFLGGVLSEGVWEEGMQTASQKYFTENAFNADTDEPWYNDILNDTGNIFKTYQEILPETDMQKSIFLGALLGGIAMGVGGYKEYKENKKEALGSDGTLNLFENIINKTSKKLTGNEPFSAKKSKGLDEIFNNTLLFSIGKISDGFEKDENDPTKIKYGEDNKPVLSKALIKQLGNDQGRVLILSKLLEQSEKDGDEAAFNNYMTTLQYSFVRDYLKTPQATEVFIKEVLPSMMENTIQQRIAQEKLTPEKDSTAIDIIRKEEEKKLEDSILKIKEFQKIHDIIQKNHDFELGITPEKGDEEAFEIFSEHVKRGKEELNLRHRFTDIYQEKDDAKIKETLKNHKKFDIVKTKDSIVGSIIELNGVPTILTKKIKESLPQEEDIKVYTELSKTNYSEVIEYLSNKASYNMFKAETNKELTLLYNKKDLGIKYKEHLENAKKELNKIEFNKKITNNRVFKNTAGEFFKIIKDNGKFKLFKAEANENEEQVFTHLIHNDINLDNYENILQDKTAITSNEEIDKSINTEEETDLSKPIKLTVAERTKIKQQLDRDIRSKNKDSLLSTLKKLKTRNIDNYEALKNYVLNAWRGTHFENLTGAQGISTSEEMSKNSDTIYTDKYGNKYIARQNKENPNEFYVSTAEQFNKNFGHLKLNQKRTYTKEQLSEKGLVYSKPLNKYISEVTGLENLDNLISKKNAQIEIIQKRIESFKHQLERYEEEVKNQVKRITTKKSGYTELSKAKSNTLKKIDSVEGILRDFMKSINGLESAINAMENSITEIQKEIDYYEKRKGEVKDDISLVDNIATLKKEKDKLVGLRKVLQDLYNFLSKQLKRLIQYDKRAKTLNEINAPAKVILNSEAILAELEETQKRIKEVEKELQYALNEGKNLIILNKTTRFQNKLKHLFISPDKYTNDYVISDNVNEKGNSFNGASEALFSAKRDIQNLASTSGNSLISKDSRELNKDATQRRFTRFMNRFNPNNSKFKLRIIRGSDLPGDKEYFDKKNTGITKYNYDDVLYSVVVNEDNKLIDEFGKELEDQSLTIENKTNPKLVYTTLTEATENSKTLNFQGDTKYFIPESKDLVKRYGITSVNKAKEAFQEELDNVLKAWQEAREEMKASLDKGEEVLLPITAKSNGVLYLQPTTTESLLDKLVKLDDFLQENNSRNKAKILNDLDIVVAVDNTLEMGNTIISTTPGFTYVYDKATGNFIPTTIKNIGQVKVDGESLTSIILGMFEYYTNNLISQLNDSSRKKNFVDSELASKIKDENGINLEAAPGIDLTIFNILSNLVLYSPNNNLGKDKKLVNKNLETAFHFTDSSEIGGEMVIGGSMRVVNALTNQKKFIPNKYRLLNQTEKGFEMNPEFVEALTKFLENRMHRVSNVKLKNPGEKIQIPIFKNGEVTIKKISYKEHLLENAIDTAIGIPNKVMVTQDEVFGDTQVEEYEPVFVNQYLTFDYKGKKKVDLKQTPQTGENAKKVLTNQQTSEEIANAILAKEAEKVEEDKGIVIFRSEDIENQVSNINSSSDIANQIANRTSTVVLDIKDIKKAGEKTAATEEKIESIEEALKNQTDILNKDKPEIDEEDPFLRTIQSLEGEREDLLKAEEWFRSIFHNSIDFYIVHDLIQKGAFGQFKDNAVYIASEAEVGTTYHEAFHVVSQLFLTSKEQADIYAEWKANNKGKRIRNYKGELKSSETFSFKEIEEALAEDFRDYVLSGGKLKFSEKKKQSFFRRLWQTIKNLFISPVTSIDNIFEAITKGEYKSIPYNGKKTKRLNKIALVSKDSAGNIDERRSTKFFETEAMNSIDYYFFNAIRQNYGTYDIFFNTKNPTKMLKSLYISVENELTELYNKDTNNSIALSTVRTNINQAIQNIKDNKSIKDIDYTGIDLVLTPAQMIKFNSMDKTVESLTKMSSFINNKIILFASRAADVKVILDNFKNGNIEKLHADRLKSTYSISILDEETYNSDISEENLGKDTGYNASDKSIEKDVKDTVSKTVMLMLKSLPKLVKKFNGTGTVLAMNTLGLPTIIDYNVTFATLLENLHDITTLPEMVEVLNKLKNDIPSLESLFNENLLDLGKVKIGNKIDFTAYPPEKFIEAIQFLQTFSKDEQNYIMSLSQSDGTMTIVDNNDSTKKQNLLREWAANSNDEKANKNTNKFIKDVYNIKYFSKYKDKMPSLVDKLVFLEDVGIVITNTDKYSLYESTIVSKIADKLLSTILKGSKIDIWSDSIENEMYDDIRYLVDLEYKYNIEKFEHSHYGLGEKTLYNYINHSSMSKIITAIKKSETLEDLYRNVSHLNPATNAFIRKSILLQPGGYLFDELGNNRNFTNGQITEALAFGFVIDEGSQENTNSGNTATEYQDLSSIDKFRKVFNNYLGFQTADRKDTSLFNFLRPADKKVERFISINSNFLRDLDKMETFMGYLEDELTAIIDLERNPIKWNNATENKNGIVIDIIRKGFEIMQENSPNNKEIYNSEIELIPEFLNRNWNKSEEGQIIPQENVDTIIQEFLNKDKKDLFKKAILTYFKDTVHNKTNGTIKFLEDGGVLTYNKRNNNYIQSGLNLKSELTFDDVNSKLMTFNMLDTIMNIEQMKILIGNPIFFKNVSTLFKRIGSYPGTIELMVEDEFTNDYIHNIFKRVDGHISLTVDGKAKENQLILNDPIVINKALGYEGMEESDGFSLITLDSYREMMLRSGKWNMNNDSLEDLYQYEMQTYYGNAKDENGNLFISEDKFEEIFGHKWEGVVRSPLNTDRIIKKPTDKVFNSLKPLYVGPYGSEIGHIPGIVKTSFGIMMPSTMIALRQNGEITNMEKMMNHMMKNQIGILSFASANKGATTKLDSNNKITELYDEEGNLNMEEIEKSPLQQLQYRYLGIQVETGTHSKYKVIMGTQMMKHILGSLMDKGISSPWAKEYIAEYTKLNAERIALGKNILLTKLGLNRNDDGTTSITDISIIKKLLRQEAVKRNMFDNLIEQIEDLDDEYGIDSLLESAKFEEILFSLADSTAIKQKTNGKSAYQFAPTLLEVKARKRYKGKKGVEYDSSDLAFYKKGEYNEVTGKINETTSIEIYIPDFYNGLVKINDTIEERDNNELLQLVGFRIPTQGLNSIDSIVVKGFLPKEAGDIVILPSEIIKKAGSDYDIDKLNIYLPNTYVDEYNKVKYINKGTYEEYEKSVFNIIKNRLIPIIRNKSNSSDLMYSDLVLINPIVNSIIKELKQKKDIIDTLDTVQEVILDTKIQNVDNKIVLDILDEISIMIKEAEFKFEQILLSEDVYNLKATENQITKLQRKIITSPENFNNLTRPIDSKLLPNLANDIFFAYNNKKREGNERYSDISNRLFLLDIAKRFMQGKAMVGIGALASTFHILSQLHNVYINDYYSYYNKDDKNFIASTRINLLHNKTAEGKIALGGLKDASKSEADKQDLPYVFNLWLNSFVDAAKDPFIFDMNVNLQTLNTVLYLTMAGVPIKDLMFFINQPIIKDYVRLQEKWESDLMEVTDKKKFKDGILKETLNLYGFSQSGELNKILNYDNSNDHSDKFEDFIQESKNKYQTAEYKNAQRDILSDFIRYQDIAKKLSTGIQGVSYDTNGAGKNIGELYIRTKQTELVQTDSNINPETGIIETVIGNYDKIIQEDSFIAPYYKEVNNLKKEYAPIISSLRDTGFMNALKFFINKNMNAIKVLPKKRLSKIVTKLGIDYKSYILSTQPYLLKDLFDENGNPIKNKIKNEYKKLVAGEHNLANKLQRFKDSGLYQKNSVITTLLPIFKDSSYKYNHIIMSNTKLDPIKANQFIKDWESLLYSGKPYEMNFAKDLLILSIAQSGISKSPISFINLAPQKLYKMLFTSTMDNYHANINNKDKVAKDFVGLHYIENHKNKDLVPKSSKKTKLNNLLNSMLAYTNDIQEQYDKLVTKDLQKAFILKLRKLGVKIYKSTPNIRQGERNLNLKEEFIQEPRKGRSSTAYSTLDASTVFGESGLNFLTKGLGIKGNEVNDNISKTNKKQSNNQQVETIDIWSSTKNGYEILSNLHPRKFTYEGKEYQSVEHAYQTLKSGKFDEVTYNNKDWGKGNIKISGTLGTDTKTNERLMYHLMLTSIGNSQEAKDLLIDSKDIKFTHVKGDSFWKNKFPELLERIRESFKC